MYIDILIEKIRAVLPNKSSDEIMIIINRIEGQYEEEISHKRLYILVLEDIFTNIKAK